MSSESHDSKQHWFKAFSYLPLDLIIIAGVWMLHMHTNATIDERLKLYIDSARYERERQEHKLWGDQKVIELDTRILRVEANHNGLKDKIDRLSIDLATVSTEVREINKKLDQLVGKPK